MEEGGHLKQFELIQKLIIQNRETQQTFAPYGCSAGNKQLKETEALLLHRVKILRMADAPPYGWITVQEYENNPLAYDEEDDKKIRRAEKSAQEIAEKKAAETKANRQGSWVTTTTMDRGILDHQPQHPRQPGKSLTTTRRTEVSRTNIHTDTPRWWQTSHSQEGASTTMFATIVAPRATGPTIVRRGNNNNINSKSKND